MSTKTVITAGDATWKYNGDTRQWAKFEATIISDLNGISAMYLLNPAKVRKMLSAPTPTYPEPQAADEPDYIFEMQKNYQY
jgi:hypothetical protein